MYIFCNHKYLKNIYRMSKVDSNMRSSLAFIMDFFVWLFGDRWIVLGVSGRSHAKIQVFFTLLRGDFGYFPVYFRIKIFKRWFLKTVLFLFPTKINGQGKLQLSCNFREMFLVFISIRWTSSLWERPFISKDTRPWIINEMVIFRYSNFNLT